MFSETDAAVTERSATTDKIDCLLPQTAGTPHRIAPPLCFVSPAGTSVSSLAFNRDGTQLAIGVSYAFDQGPSKEGKPADAIVLRAVADSDVRPKATAKTA